MHDIDKEVQMNGRKKFVLLGVLIAAAASFAAWAIPYPRDHQEVVVRYYSSAAHVELVGVHSYQGMGCDIYHETWGTATQYREIEVLPCPQLPQ